MPRGAAKCQYRPADAALAPVFRTVFSVRLAPVFQRPPRNRTVKGTRSAQAELESRTARTRSRKPSVLQRANPGAAHVKRAQQGLIAKLESTPARDRSGRRAPTTSTPATSGASSRARPRLGERGAGRRPHSAPRQRPMDRAAGQVDRGSARTVPARGHRSRLGLPKGLHPAAAVHHRDLGHHRFGAEKGISGPVKSGQVQLPARRTAETGSLQPASAPRSRGDSENTFLHLCVEVGQQVLETLTEQDRERLCSPKGKHLSDQR